MLIDGLTLSLGGTVGDPIDVEVRNAGPGPLTLRDVQVDGASLVALCPISLGSAVDTCRIVIQMHQCGDAFYLDGQLASIFPIVIQEGVSCHFSLYYVQSGLGDLHGTFTVESDAASTRYVIPITASRSTPVFFGVPVTDTARVIVSLDDLTGCGFTDAAWLPPPKGSSATAGFAFAHGLFHLELRPCLPGETKSVRMEFSDPLPAGTKYLKFGPTSDNHVPHWYEIPSTVKGNAIEFAVTDGGLGDDDLTVNGVIVDEGGPAIPLSVAIATAVPTLSPYALIALLVVLFWLGMSACHRRQR